MISVKRHQITEDGTPIKPLESWFEEAKIQKALAISEGENHEVSDLYRNDRVQSALEELFKFKCAYCESLLGPANGMDVEHYRPKGSVAERDDHPGYYWLAYDWENLYPACQLCNQRRKDKPLFDEFKTLPSAGKLDQFPIKDESKRAMAPGDSIEDEEPLLLDPNADHPENHITFDLLGKAIALDPGDEHALKTIKICNLNRRRLAKARRRRLQEVKAMMTEFSKLFGDVTPDRLRAAVRNAFVQPDCPYSACVRAMLDNPEALG